MSTPSFSGSFDPLTRLVAHVPIKFIVGALAAFRIRDGIRLRRLNGTDMLDDYLGAMVHLWSIDSEAPMGPGNITVVWMPSRRHWRGIAMRSVVAVMALVVGFGCSAGAGEKPLTELLAACDQVAANPFDNTRPAGVPGVSFTKIVPETAISACEEAATAAPDDARIAMELGRAYLAAKDFNAARMQFFKAYQQGNAQAAANLAFLYMNGQGVPKDDTEALRLSKIAAEQGNAQGQNSLGSLLGQGRGGPKNDIEAARLFKLSADQGYPPAQNNLGQLYQMGRGGLPKDDREAVRLFKLAADQGVASAQAHLGFAYLGGLGGLSKDDGEAVRLFKLSADQGNSLGQANLGFAYERGLGGLPKDEREAARLYKLAADQGLAGAQSFLDRINGAPAAAK
jgi:TPR repeat protein